MKKITKLMMTCALSSLVLVSCESDPEPEVLIPGAPTAAQGIYALTEGNFYTGIEGGLDVLTFSTGETKQNVFKAANGRSLGDTPQCGVAYGSKIYIGTSQSNTIEIIDRITWKSVKQINVADVTPGGYPYSMVTYKGKIFISMFGGNLARLDTLTMSIDKVVPVGNNPDRIALYKNKIYVPVSDGMNYPNYGKTAVVVDPETMNIEKTFETGLNPRQFLVAADHLFLLCMGNYGDVPSTLYHVNDDYSLEEVCEATIVADYGNQIAIINQPFTEEEPIVEYKLYSPRYKTFEEWNIERPDYANNMYYDLEAGVFVISSYVMNGKYPSYELPGYVNQYNAGSNKVVKRYNLGSAGRTCFFTLEK